MTLNTKTEMDGRMRSIAVKQSVVRFKIGVIWAFMATRGRYFSTFINIQIDFHPQFVRL